MIHLSKTAVVLSVMVCGVGMMCVGAQQPDEPGPSPRPEPRQQGAARSATRPSSGAAVAEPSPTAEPAPAEAPRRFVGPPGLSQEALRSFTEMPPTALEPGSEPVPEPESPAEAAQPAPTNASPSTPRSAPVAGPQRPEYVVEPPDMLLVEVLEALPGRPISGERLVRPDGRIGLGFYGEVPVAGLTLSQVKERIVLHLRKFLDDEKLGLVGSDPGSRASAPRRDASGRVLVKDPRQTDRVFVDVTAYNSQNYYVLGEVVSPGRLPHTGGDSVLDVLQYAGGLLPTADKGRIRLIRSFPKGSPVQVLPVDYNEIAMGTDSSTNYPILPNDRLVIPAASASSRDVGPLGLAEPATERGEPGREPSVVRRMKSDPGAESTGYFNRLPSRPARDPNAELERRIVELDRKLDRLIELVSRNRSVPAVDPGMLPRTGNPFDDGARPTGTGRMERPAARRGQGGVGSPGPQSPGPRRSEPAGPRRGNDRDHPGDEPRRDPGRSSNRPPGLGVPDGDIAPFDLVPPDARPE